MKLAGRVAAVTGGGSGIGRACARRLAVEGATVVVLDIDPVAATETTRLLRAGARHTEIELDVADSGAVEAALHELEREHDRLDVLVNCAGGGERAELTVRAGEMLERAAAARRAGDLPTWNFFALETSADFQYALMVNLVGTFNVIRAAVPLMARIGGGTIVNVSSVAALVGEPRLKGYPAAKAGILSLTRAAAVELAPRGIRVNAIAPGPVDTPATAAMPAAMRDRLTEGMPLARFAAPEEIASAVLFLCTDESSYFVGQTLSPNGGMHM